MITLLRVIKGNILPREIGQDCVHKRKFTFHLDNAVLVVCVHLESLFMLVPGFARSKHLMSSSRTTKLDMQITHHYAVALCMS